jgi:hypothetical protein
MEQHKEKLCQLADETVANAKATTTRTTLRSFERMRFVECMVLDSVKPLYLKVHEVMNRYELDGRNSEKSPPDFYDVVTDEFNNVEFAPVSRCLPHLHDRLSNQSNSLSTKGYL